jgi:uncharacterized protein (DUF342 family)
MRTLVKIPFMKLSEKQGETARGSETPKGIADPGVSTVMPENKNDGRIVIVFTENDIEARVDFIPPFGDGAAITDEYIASVLSKLNIVYGTKWDAIGEAMTACNLNRRPVKDVLIARGDAPENEVGEYFERNPHIQVSNVPGEGQELPQSNARVDYRSYSPFIIVKQNQVLAKLRPRKAGRDGKNVHGVMIPYKVIRREGVEAGENTRLDGQFIIAKINGQLVETNKTMNVRDSLVIKGPVGYATGNITFPGDVVIDGPVSDGFKIYSGGSVTIKQTFDVTDVITKTDLNVAGGIIGRGRALVKVGASLKTKFIENCRVACRNTVTVDKEIINSSVFTMATLEMGDRGIILGSDIYAMHGLRAGGIGRKAGKSTQIHCGVDFTLQQEKEKANNQLRMLAAKLTKLRELMAAPRTDGEDPERRAGMEELLHRLEEEQKKAGLQIAGVLKKTINDENAVVEISGDIIPGTLIEICQIALFIAEPIRKVRIRLDKIQGKLVCENL